MAIFGNSVLESYSNVNVSGVMGTMESSDQMLLEFAEDIYKVRAGLYVADSIIEQTALTEGYEAAEPLMENAVTDMFKKIKEAIIKLWNKVKAWFKEVLRVLGVLFTTNKNLLSKYKDEIKKRAKKPEGYKYTGYIYNISKLDSECKKITDIADEYAFAIDNITIDASTTKEGLTNSLKAVAGETDDFTETMSGKCVSGATTIADVKKELVDIARDGATSTHEIVDFADTSADAMITFLEGFDKAINTIKKDENTSNSTFNKLVTAYAKLERSVDKLEKAPDGLSGVISNATANVKSALSLRQGATAVKQQMYKEAQGTYFRALKGILTYKKANPTTEGYVGSSSNGSSSILESAMRFI